MVKVRTVNYAGFSRAVNEKGEVTHNFHTSNNTKYAVWANLPTEEGHGYQVTFNWFKVPAGTEKLAAVRILLDKDVVKADAGAVEMLNGLLTKAEPKQKAPKVAKVKQPKAPKVTVTVKAKPEATVKGINAIRQAAEALAAKRAAKKVAAA